MQRKTRVYRWFKFHTKSVENWNPISRSSKLTRADRKLPISHAFEGRETGEAHVDQDFTGAYQSNRVQIWLCPVRYRNGSIGSIAFKMSTQLMPQFFTRDHSSFRVDRAKIRIDGLERTAASLDETEISTIMSKIENDRLKLTFGDRWSDTGAISAASIRLWFAKRVPCCWHSWFSARAACKRAAVFTESLIFSRRHYAQLFHNCAQFLSLQGTTSKYSDIT